MNNIIRELFVVSRMISSARIAFRIVEDPKRIRMMAEKLGLVFGENGEVLSYTLTGLGYFDFTKPAKPWASSLDKAIGREGHIKDGVQEYIDRYKNLLEDLSRYNKRADSAWNSGTEDVSDLLKEFDEKLAVYISPRARTPQIIKINSLLTAIRKSSENKTFSDIKAFYGNIEKIVADLLSIYKMQLATSWQRKQLLLALRGAREKNKDLFHEIYHAR